MLYIQYTTVATVAWMKKNKAMRNDTCKEIDFGGYVNVICEWKEKKDHFLPSWANHNDMPQCLTLSLLHRPLYYFTPSNATQFYLSRESLWEGKG